MIPMDPKGFVYLGRRDTFTEEEEQMGRETREGFERCFLPRGVTLRPCSDMKE